MLRVNLVMAVAVMFSALSTVVRAESVPLLVNQTTGATIFDDNFEGGTGLKNPVATVGTWSASDIDNNSVVQGSTDRWGGAPAANEGTQMVGLWSSTQTTWLLGTGVAANSGSNDVVKMDLAFRIASGTEISIYGESGATDIFQIGLFGPAAAGIGFANNSVHVVNSTGTAWLDTGFVSDPNAWNRLTVTHVNGTTSWEISVNGSAAYTATGIASVSTMAWNGLYIKNDVAGVVGYFDAVPVPEPSALALLTAGLFGLLAYAWRKRK